jgi:hypothetical protein
MIINGTFFIFSVLIDITVDEEAGMAKTSLLPHARHLFEFTVRRNLLHDVRPYHG